MAYQDPVKQRAYMLAWRAKQQAHVSTYQKAYRQNNAQHVKAAQQAYGHKNRAILTAKQRARRQANPAKHRAANKRYQATHRATIRLQQQRWNDDHPEQVRKAKRKYAHQHPALSQIAVEKRRARKANAPRNDLTHTQWLHIQAAQEHRCAYCGKRAKGRLSQDHLTPLAKGGSHTLHNVIAACRVCNSRKGTRPAPILVQPLLL